MVLWLRRERLIIFHQKRREVLFVTWCNGNWQAAEQHISRMCVHTLILNPSRYYLYKIKKVVNVFSSFFFSFILHCWQHLAWVDQRKRNFFFLSRPATTTARTTCTFTVYLQLDCFPIQILSTVSCQSFLSFLCSCFEYRWYILE